jgi:uncharacterized protein YqeY
LRDDLKVAMKARDAAATTALRTALAALANAEAVDAVAVAHDGPAEVARRELTEADRADVLRAHVLDRQATIDELRAHDQDGPAAADLEAELAALLRYL